MSGYYERQSARRRHLLELIVLQVNVWDRRRFRRTFLACKDIGLGVLGYKKHLEDSLGLVNRAITAINAVEGNG